MKLRYLASVALAALLLAAPAQARQWNPDARTAALDYAQIFHTKAAGEIVVVWWVVPETFLNSPNSQSVRDVLSRYVIVGVTHGRAAPGTAPSFDNVATLSIGDFTGRALQPLRANALPRDVSDTVANLRTLAQQSLGPMGAGLRWFVFDGSTIHSCQPGRMTVPFQGEVYSYDTPIPGCPTQR